MFHAIILRPRRPGVIPSAIELKQAGFHVATSACLPTQNNGSFDSPLMRPPTPPTPSSHTPDFMANTVEKCLSPSK